MAPEGRRVPCRLIRFGQIALDIELAAKRVDGRIEVRGSDESTQCFDAGELVFQFVYQRIRNAYLVHSYTLLPELCESTSGQALIRVGHLILAGPVTSR